MYVLKIHTIFVKDKYKMAAVGFFKKAVILCILLDSASK